MLRRTLAVSLAIVSLGSASVSAGTLTRWDPLDADIPSLDVVSTSRIVWREDGRKMIRFVILFSVTNTSIFDGRIRLDARGDAAADAVISYSHWDNGPRPNECVVHALGTRRSGEAATGPSIDRFRCTFPIEWLRPTHPVRWQILHGDAQGAIVDRAPNAGWYA